VIKTFQYKAYRPSTTNVLNRVIEGDFEGERSVYGNSWQLFGTGGTVQRTAVQAYPTSPTGNASIFNGYSSYMSIPYTSSNGLFTAYAGVIVWAYRSNWNDTLRQAIFSNDYRDGANAAGFGLHINYTSGNVSAIVGLGVTTIYTEAAYALSNLASGWHQFAMKFSGTTLVLYVDGAAVTTTTVAANSIGYGTNNYQNPTFVGAQRSSAGVVATIGNYFFGSIDSVAIYISGSTDPLTTAQVLANYQTHVIQEINCSHSFSFDYDTGTLANEVFNGNIATLNNITFQIGFLETAKSLVVTTSVGGSSTQGVMNTTSGQIVITGGNSYTASCWAKGAAGISASLQVTPIGGGSVASKSFTLTGAWQRLSFSYTTNIAATKLELDIFVNNAASSIQTLYVDKVMLEDGFVLHDYFNRFSTNKAGSFYAFNVASNTHTATLTTYTYLTTWNDVTSDFTYNQEINNAGSESTIVIARPADNFGEGADVDFNNRIVVSVISDSYPNGQAIFAGFISRYKPTYGEDKIEVTVLGYGAEMDNYTISSGETILTAQEDNTNKLLQMIQSVNAVGELYASPADQTSISAVSLYLGSYCSPQTTDKNGNVIPAVYSYGNTKVKVFDTFQAAYLSSYTGSLNSSFIPLATSTINFIPVTTDLTYTNPSPAWYKFNFVDLNGNPAPIRLSKGQQVWFSLSTDAAFGVGQPSIIIYGSTVNPYADGYSFYNDNSATPSYTILSNSDLAFRVYSSFGLTTAAYNSKDPSTILKGIIDDYNRQGGSLTYTSSSIDLTATTVSYTFNTNSTLEGLKKCLELSPVDWYFYVDQATGIIYFKNRSSARVRPIVFDRDIKSLYFEKTTENIVNQIIFSGGLAAGSTTNLFKKYDNKISQTLYGLHQQRYSDNRVTLSSTSDIIANTILNTRYAPEIRTEVEIINPYEFESIRPGDVMTFRGFKSSGGSLYDVAIYDTDYFDFNLADPQTFLLQIARYTYEPDRIRLTLSTTPPDVNKRIEDIKRQLDSQATIANPVAPS
jgi:hypothetical protein